MTAQRNRGADVRSIKARLSEKEFVEQRNRLENAAKTVEELRDLLASVLFLRNGRLSTGDIRYAAFRVETLSLIFELARRAFMKTGEGMRLYYEYLDDLGDEVGFTFALELISRLVENDELKNIKNRKQLLELWASYENDTGAGETSTGRVSSNQVVVRLRNNPLRYVETESHAHCRFYQSYLKTLVNELFTRRARLMREEYEDTSVESPKVLRVMENPDTDDNCVFELELCSEKLTEAFDLFESAITAFEKDQYEACLNNARGALVTAQYKKLSIDERSAPKQFYKVFQEVLDKKQFKLMDDVYQRVSKPFHPESTEGSEQLGRSQIVGILRDIRRSVYALEVAPLSADDAVQLVRKARRAEILSKLLEELLNVSELEKADQALIRDKIRELQKAELDQDRVNLFIEWLRQRLAKAPSKVWGVIQPVLSELIATAVKKQTGLL